MARFIKKSTGLTGLAVAEKPHEENDIQKLEEKINCGQVEEAENELSLARKMLTWKPWEPPIGPVPKDQWKWPPV
ncbi:hypothetical protein KUTeg_021089 [Tegillarca granosa]|uniref:NADH dehydrogenase [ubiquinone] 1 alpha subcomplex subunit 5 n=1 Tax=Tegillarca granosa TaxID=220873 RepID=A0ABQ9EDX3_TEGGR|nr:hypothetical protein KUTeg_021089 [Tegillarca granosa]